MKIERSIRKERFKFTFVVICLLFLYACDEINFMAGSNRENLSADEAICLQARRDNSRNREEGWMQDQLARYKLRVRKFPSTFFVKPTIQALVERSNM